jgi:NADPH:quinone reductase-like Zn-dependent oxidoreductase
MKAVVFNKYGPPEVLQLVDIPKPVPQDNQVLIKVLATTVTVGDTRMRSFVVPWEQWLFARFYLGLFQPKRPILGMEIAGTIEEIGKNVTGFKAGDPVFASTMEADFGGYAQYKCLPEDGLLTIKPKNLTFEEAAAAVGAGMTALRCLQKGHIQSGQKILIYGASGAVGTNAVQLAKNLYGAEVTGVCSTANVEMVKVLGADHVIDYTKEDFACMGETYDIVFDAVAKISAAHAKKALKKSGVYLNVHRDSHNESDQLGIEELNFLKEVIESGKVKPYIDRSYPLEQIVEAHHYVDKGHKKGNVVITIAHPDNG